MKTIVMVLLFATFFLTSCSTIPRTICPENEYKNLNDVPIYITTNDTISLFIDNNRTVALLQDELISNYKFESNLFEIKIGNYQSKINISKVAKVEFNGIYQKGVGIISEKELLNNMKQNSTLWGTLSGILGSFIGAGISNLITPFRFDNNSGTLLIIGAIVGGTTGAICGYNYSYKREVEKAIEKIEQNRLNKEGKQ